MPGLVGIADFGGSSDLRDLVASTTKAICHRPWHKAQCWVSDTDPVALGRVDTGVFGGRVQPVFNADQSVALVMEGEFFVDHRPARDLHPCGRPVDTDSEAALALRLYEKHGERFVVNLEGFYNIIIWDGSRRRLIILNDRMGFRPLYRSTVGRRLLLCSEVKGLLADARLARDPDIEGVSHYFAFGHPLGDRTLVQGVLSLPGACIASFSPLTGWTCSTYWHLDAPEYHEAGADGPEAYLEELGMRFRAGLEKQMTKGGLTAQSLTGGLDSRAARAAIDPSWPLAATFTHGVPNCLDLVLARRVAEEAGNVPHYSYELAGDYLVGLPELAADVAYRSDGLARLAQTAFAYSRAKVRQHAQIELSSGGADYSRGWGLNTRAIRSAQDLGELERACAHKYITDYRRPTPFSHAALRRLSGAAEDGLRQVLRAPREGTPLLMRANYFYVMEHIVKLVRVSWQLISSDLELRLPYWSYDYVDALLRAPLNLTTKERAIPRYFISRYNPRLAEIPFAVNNMQASLSEALACRWKRRLQALAELNARRHVQPKLPGIAGLLTFSRPYADIDNWLRSEPLLAWIRSVLLDPRTIDRGYYCRQGISEMLDRHLSRRGDLGGPLGALVMFELWCRASLD